MSFELADDRAPGTFQGFYGTGQAVGMMFGPVLATGAIAVGPVGWLGFAATYAVLGVAGWTITRAGAG